MKTSELKKIVEENGFLFRITNNLNVYIDNEAGNLFSIQNLETIYVERERVVHTKTAKNVMRALLDYSETPLEEREEEEKKYMLRVPFSRCTYLNSFKNEYLFAGRIQENGYQTHFTQKEIDVMPFDTNFFIKEEVQ